MLRSFVSYLIFVICFSFLILMPIQVSETSPSETPNTLSASASCSVSNFPPLFIDLDIELIASTRYESLKVIRKLIIEYAK